MLVGLKERLGKFGLTLHAGKTRLIHFGRWPAGGGDAAHSDPVTRGTLRACARGYYGNVSKQQTTTCPVQNGVVLMYKHLLYRSVALGGLLLVGLLAAQAGYAQDDGYQFGPAQPLILGLVEVPFADLINIEDPGLAVCTEAFIRLHVYFSWQYGPGIPPDTVYANVWLDHPSGFTSLRGSVVVAGLDTSCQVPWTPCEGDSMYQGVLTAQWGQGPDAVYKSYYTPKFWYLYLR